MYLLSKNFNYKINLGDIMQDFLNEFNIFFTSISNNVTSTYEWLMSTILGKIIAFVFIISIFVYIISVFIRLKD